MKKTLLIILFLIVTLFLFANPITNVRAMQEGKKIVILYDLSEDTFVSQITMEVDGKSRVIPNQCLKGDINKNLTLGTDKRVEYDVLVDYTDGFKSNNVVFEVQISKYEAVDLGLSVKWATCNVGASKPEEYGDYFAWGEIKPKKQYSWSTYKYCKGTNETLTKYCDSREYGNNGFTDNKTVLDSADDVATVNWGGLWRMPTDKEFGELRTKCKWKWTKQNGVKGYKVIGKNGNSIFLPAAGFMGEVSLFNAGVYGNYCSNFSTGYPYDAYYVSFNSYHVRSHSDSRYFGYSVRPVCP